MQASAVRPAPERRTPSRPRQGIYPGLLAYWLAGLLVAGAALAQDGDPGAAGPSGVGLGQLLKLPDSYRVEPQGRSRRSEEDWRVRFSHADEEIVAAERELKRLQETLGRRAGETSAYQMTAPGMGSGSAAGGTENAPMSFPLRERIRRQKELVVEAKRDRRDLVVEANLADIPKAWRAPRQDPEIGGDRGQ